MFVLIKLGKDQYEGCLLNEDVSILQAEHGQSDSKNAGVSWRASTLGGMLPAVEVFLFLSLHSLLYCVCPCKYELVDTLFC